MSLTDDASQNVSLNKLLLAKSPGFFHYMVKGQQVLSENLKWFSRNKNTVIGNLKISSGIKNKFNVYFVYLF